MYILFGYMDPYRGIHASKSDHASRYLLWRKPHRELHMQSVGGINPTVSVDPKP